MKLRKRSDIEEFEEIVGRCQDRLFRFAFIRIGVRETAEDMVQDVLVRCFHSIRDGAKISNPEFFLLRSLSNACTDYYRRKKPPTYRLEEAEGISNEEDDRDIEAEFQRINRLLDGLPPEQAEILRLKCYDGLTFREIAELQELPEATVKSRYRYGLQHMRRWMEEL